MSKESRDIAEAIRALSGMDDLMWESSACKVKSVDTTNMTCNVEPLDGSADLLDVRLNANYGKGFTLVPKKDSIVVVTQLSEATAFVSMVSEVEQIYLAGDENGGLIKIDDLKSQYDAAFNAIKTACIAAYTAQSAIDGSLGLNAFNASITALQPLNKSTLENKKVQHGNG